MNIKEFIENFADAIEFEGELTPVTEFRQLKEWSSMGALMVIGMIDDEFDVQLSALEMRNTQTIQQLFDLVQSKL